MWGGCQAQTAVRHVLSRAGVNALSRVSLQGRVFHPHIHIIHYPSEYRYMEYKRLSRCGIDNCKQTLFYPENGRWFCKNGHMREVRKRDKSSS
jgi:hypothetical protein